MNTTWVDEMIATAMPLLEKWQGTRVQWWEYTPTHMKLTLRLESSTKAGNLHLVCAGCRSVRGSFSWNDCDFNLAHSVDEERVIVLTDERAGFELRCEVLAVEENVDPIYQPNLGART